MNTDISKIVNNKWFGLGVASVASFAVGFYLGRQNRKVVYVTDVEYIEVETERDYEVKEELPIDSDAVIQEELFVEHTAVVAKPPTNRFTKPQDDLYDPNVEEENRQKGLPYVITKDDYIRNERDYKQETVTYYAGDDIMADIADTPIYGYANMMGDLKFGHGSDDPNVVYIRNEETTQEWEVIRHKGKYEYEVLGQSYEDAVDRELQHSNTRTRFRPE